MRRITVIGFALIIVGVLILSQSIGSPMNGANLLGPIVIGLGVYTTLRALGGTHD